MPVTDDDLYLVWSNEHRGWWKLGFAGYSAGLSDAARMSRKEAIAVCRRAIPQSNHLGQIAEIPVRLDDVDDFLGKETPPAAILWGTEDMVR